MTPTVMDLSPLSLFLAADVVVKAVMVLLLLVSVACWTVIIEKLAALRRLRANAGALAAIAAAKRIPATADGQPALVAAALAAVLPEWSEGQGERETDGEFRSRLERAARRGVGVPLGRAHAGLQLLATTGSVAPFVGLFGTVWGIMNSFSGIAASNDTSLAVVAPGIAEALFATAIGLVAAIPAVVGYNRISASANAVRQAALLAAGDLAYRLARSPSPAAAARPHLHLAE